MAVTLTFTPVAGGLILTWVSAGTERVDVVFSVSPPLTETDVPELQIDNDPGFTSLFGSDTRTVGAAGAASDEIMLLNIPTLQAGTTYYARLRVNGGAWSNTVPKAIS